jgi:hypothetical protein
MLLSSSFIQSRKSVQGCTHAACVIGRGREGGSRSGTHGACVSVTASARGGSAALDLELASKSDCGPGATGPRNSRLSRRRQDWRAESGDMFNS